MKQEFETVDIQKEDKKAWDELKNARDAKGWSLGDLAHQTGISSATLSTYERDMPPMLKRFLDICIALDVSPNQLLSWTIPEHEETCESMPTGTTIARLKLILTMEDLTLINEMLSDQDKELRQSMMSGFIDSALVEHVNKMYDTIKRVKDQIDILSGAMPQKEAEHKRPPHPPCDVPFFMGHLPD